MHRAVGARSWGIADDMLSMCPFDARVASLPRGELRAEEEDLERRVESRA